MISFSSAQIDGFLAGLLWPLVRILALVATMPVIGHRAVPTRVKVGLAVLATAVIAPTIPTGGEYSLASGAGLAILVQQILIGVAMGFTIRVIFAAIELAGEIMGVQMGLNFVGFFDPQSGQMGTPLGSWLGLIMTLVFLAMNGHLMVLYALGESFRILPIAPDVVAITDWKRMALLGAEMFRIGVYASLPVVTAMLICNVVLGALARIAPQLNLLAISFSVTLLVGFAVLLLALPIIGSYLEQAMLRGIGMMLVR